LVSFDFRKQIKQADPLLWIQQGSLDPSAIFDCIDGWGSYSF